MRYLLVFLGFLGLPGAVLAGDPAPTRLSQRVLYIGDNPERSRQFSAFLAKHFTRVETTRRTGFDPARARDADVVLLDWQQGEGPLEKAESPLGERQRWSKPTVLLGSAGLLLSVAWDIRGGAG
jgi:hypothetical protein